ncbi:MAG: hypothetical protein V4736_10730 [Bdellovibrionota bacterium]
MNLAEQAHTIIKRLLELGIAPSHIEHSELGPFSIVNMFNDVNSPIISDSVTTGFDENIDVAAMKALAEWTERRAFDFGHESGQTICQTDRSDGFAAYPTGVENHRALARQNSFNESLERFVWATWWDNEDISFEISTDLSDLERSLIAIGSEFQNISQTIRIKPVIFGMDDHEVSIYFSELTTGGFISGGACDLKSNRKSTTIRAIGELIRHAQGANLIKNGQSAKTFYERRLAYFLTEGGVKAVQSRLNKDGSKGVTLPKLKFDSEVFHPASDVIYVHRCLFENQPEFVGGALERLCL